MTKIFEYLSKGHQMTSLGLLLGMAATRRGTMDAGVAKLLSIHLPVRFPRRMRFRFLYVFIYFLPVFPSSPPGFAATLLNGFGRRTNGPNHFAHRRGLALRRDR